MAHGPTTRRMTVLLTVACIVVFFFISSFRNLAQGTRDPAYIQEHSEARDAVVQSDVLISGHVIAPKLGNETAKAELGRSAWKLFHTTFARFPDNPTADESLALKTYVYLFQRLYPCGECADHFRQILEKYPPQVSSRSAAAAWGCHVHNEVNKSLKKEIFNCAEIGDFYDCGCADDEDDLPVGEGTRASRVPGTAEAEDERQPVELQREGYQRGG